MPASFIPLAPQAPITASPRVNAPLTPAGGAPSVPIRPFQPLTVPVSQPAASSAVTPKPDVIANPASQGPCGSPTIVAQRSEGQVTHVRIQCKCGEVIDLECLH